MAFIKQIIYMNQSIEYFQQSQEQLYTYMVSSTQSVLSLEKILTDIIQCIQQFSKGLESIGQKLHELINAKNESDLIVLCYQQLSNYLLKISNDWDQTSRAIHTDVSEPFTQFITNFRSTNRAMNAESKSQIEDIKNHRLQMTKCQEEYWKLMRTSELASLQVQQMVDQIEKGIKTKEDFQNSFNHSYRIQQSAEEAEKDYKKFIEITNLKWTAFHESWEQIFQNVGLNDQSRNNFSKQTINTLLKVLNLDQQNFQEYDQKLALIEQKLNDDPKIPVKQLIEKKLQLKGTQIKQFQYEEFISYESWKKINENQQVQLIDQWQVVGEELQESEKLLLDHYIGLLLNNKQYDQDDMHIKIKQILQKSSGRMYFVEQLSNLHKQSNNYYLQIDEEIFYDLTSLIKSWLNYVDLNDQYDCEEIYKLLSISTRIITQGHQKKINISSQLSDILLWAKSDKWSQLFFFISGKKIDDKKKRVQTLKEQGSGNFLSKGIKFFGKGIGIFQKQQHQFDVNEEEIIYQILEEINLFIISLQLKAELSADIILYIASQHSNIDKDHVVKLLEKQEERNNTQLKKQLTQGKLILQHKIEKFDNKRLYDLDQRVIYVINLSLPYLSLEDRPEKFLLINKQFYHALQVKIQKFYLCYPKIFQGLEQEQQRIHFINTALQSWKSKIDYIQMKVDVGINMDLKKSVIEETIQLDVLRSLHIHKQRISSSILQSLLRIYSYFNQDVGYCQGMNYIAGYLYLTFNNESTTYIVFDKVMELYFKPIFMNDFQKLKCGFYQFDRLLSIFIPDLSSHLKEEKIDSSYYASSWFITMFSNVFQYSMRSAMLNVIWDIFLVEGWKGIFEYQQIGYFKCSFFLLYILSDKLMELEFDEILHYLGQLIKSELFQIDNEQELIKYLNKSQLYDKIDHHYKIQDNKQTIEEFRGGIQLFLSQVKLENERVFQIMIFIIFVFAYELPYCQNNSVQTCTYPCMWYPNSCQPFLGCQSYNQQCELLPNCTINSDGNRCMDKEYCGNYDLSICNSTLPINIEEGICQQQNDYCIQTQLNCSNYTKKSMCVKGLDGYCIFDVKCKPNQCSRNFTMMDGYGIQDNLKCNLQDCGNYIGDCLSYTNKYGYPCAAIDNSSSCTNQTVPHLTQQKCKQFGYISIGNSICIEADINCYQLQYCNQVSNQGKCDVIYDQNQQVQCILSDCINKDLKTCLQIPQCMYLNNVCVIRKPCQTIQSQIECIQNMQYGYSYYCVWNADLQCQLPESCSELQYISIMAINLFCQLFDPHCIPNIQVTNTCFLKDYCQNYDYDLCENQISLDTNQRCEWSTICKVKSCNQFDSTNCPSSCKKGVSYCYEMDVQCEDIATQIDCKYDQERVCIWNQNKCSRFNQCEDIQLNTTSLCQTYSQQCLSNGYNCITKDYCQNYNFNLCTQLIGLDGDCLIINDECSGVRSKSCVDFQFKTYQDCKKYNCTTNGQYCINYYQDCDKYTFGDQCSWSSDGFACYFEENLCRPKQCKDITDSVQCNTPNILCNSEICTQGQQCYYDNKQCNNLEYQCQNYKNTLTCIQSIQGKCMWDDSCQSIKCDNRDENSCNAEIRCYFNKTCQELEIKRPFEYNFANIISFILINLIYI
ncbi:hypothetical protein pb186bvf_016560 [Paramecium bursaria]